MVLRTIGEDSTSQDDLPWINEYVEMGGSINDSSFVTHVKKTPKGLLVLAQDFKGFLFTKSAIAGYLSEALQYWVGNSTANYPLYAIVSKGGKLSLAVDDEEALSIWIEETKGKSWQQKRKKEQEDFTQLPKSNPFLPTPPPTTNGKRKGSKEQHPDSNAMPY